MHDLADEALAHLEALTGRADARFRPDQLEAITALVADRRRVLMVQRTGWGKSAVYFIATRLLRARGSGPTIILSPLLALMRNQIDAAALDLLTSTAPASTTSRATGSVSTTSGSTPLRAVIPSTAGPIALAFVEDRPRCAPGSPRSPGTRYALSATPSPLASTSPTRARCGAGC